MCCLHFVAWLCAERLPPEVRSAVMEAIYQVGSHPGEEQQVRSNLPLFERRRVIGSAPFNLEKKICSQSDAGAAMLEPFAPAWHRRVLGTENIGRGITSTASLLATFTIYYCWLCLSS